MNYHKAPWGKSLILMSTLGTVVCVAVSVSVFYRTTSAVSWTGWLPIAVLLGCLLFVVRGYAVSGGQLSILRLLWTTRVDLVDLHSAESLPNAMAGSLRVFGNGGLFSFTGFYRNKLLGSYRAYVTDVKRTVVVRLKDRTIVLSPEFPDEFVRTMDKKPENGPTRRQSQRPQPSRRVRRNEKRNEEVDS